MVVWEVGRFLGENLEVGGIVGLLVVGKGFFNVLGWFSGSRGRWGVVYWVVRSLLCDVFFLLLIIILVFFGSCFCVKGLKFCGVCVCVLLCGLGGVGKWCGEGRVVLEVGDFVCLLGFGLFCSW